jgi:hypothetical protein
VIDAPIWHAVLDKPHPRRGLRHQLHADGADHDNAMATTIVCHELQVGEPRQAADPG